MSRTTSEGRHSFVPSGVTNHRAINEDRMSQHGIEQFVIAEAVFCQAELFVRFGIFAQQVAHADAHIRNQLLQLIA